VNNIGKRLRVLRLQKGKTLSEIAQAVWGKPSLSPLLSSYERGQKTMSDDVAKRVLDFLGFTWTDLEAIEIPDFREPPKELAQRVTLTLKEVQAYCGFKPSKTKNLIDKGLLEWIVIGLPYYVYRESLDKFLEANKSKTISLGMDPKDREKLNHL
jgi:transcriptional regulator with XRE-family HTH domain